ncbi:MAG: methyl-accepting chemotaxis protein [candidate division NC10 bacterium]|nr:methyl-accepting chemotaxis protein [candidate division NC10 bacterium]
MAERPWKRRRFYVHGIQRKYLLLSLVPLIISSFLIIFLLFIPLDLMVLFRGSPAERDAALDQVRALGVRVWPAIFLAMVISAILSIFVTHKFAGPIYRFEETVRRMADGDFSVKVTLREGDDLRELEGLMNQVLTNVGATIAALREREGALAGKLEALLKMVKGGQVGQEELLAALDEIVGQQKGTREILARFQTRVGG